MQRREGRNDCLRRSHGGGRARQADEVGAEHANVADLAAAEAQVSVKRKVRQSNIGR